MGEECEECGREFDSKRGLNIHKAQKHQKEEEKEMSKENNSVKNTIDFRFTNRQFGAFAFGLGLIVGLVFVIGLLTGMLISSPGEQKSVQGDVVPGENDGGISLDVLSYSPGVGESQDSFSWEGGEVNLEDRPYIGDSESDIVIVSYEDFTCVWCSRHNTERAFPSLLESEINDGDVQYFYRHFPRTPTGEEAAEASECIRQQDEEKFWQAKEHFYGNFQSISQGGFDEVLDETIRGLELDEEEFNSCMDSGSGEEFVESDRSEASGYDYTYEQQGQVREFVAATPSFLIHNRETGETVAEAGAIPYEEFQAHMEQ